MKKNHYFLLAIMMPFFASAALYTPEDTDNVYYVKEGNDYEIHLFLKNGSFFKFDSVEYKNSRYLLLEETARMINEDRKFTSFDDDDLVYLLDGTVPYTNEDIKSVDVVFTDTEVSIVADFFTGGGFSVTEEYTTKFITKQQVAEYVVELINKQDGFEGQYTTAQILEQYDDFEGINYYAPAVTSIEVSYDTTEQLYVADVAFENDAEKKYAIFPKDTQRKLIVDIATRINEFYEDFEEEGGVTPDLVAEMATWKEIPIFADEIQQIVVEKKDDSNIYIMVGITSDDGFLINTLFQAAFSGDINDAELVALKVADTLDQSTEFGSEFDLLRLVEITTVGDIDLSQFSTLEGENFAENELTDTEEVEQEQSTSTTSTSTIDAQPDTVDTESSSDDVIAQLIELLIALVVSLNLDIDISALQTK